MCKRNLITAKPTVDRPDTSAMPGAPLKRWELEILRAKYPNGFFVSAYPQKSAVATRKRFRRAIMDSFRSPFNNRSLTKSGGKGKRKFNLGRLFYRIHKWGSIQPKKVNTPMSVAGLLPHSLIKKHNL